MAKKNSTKTATKEALQASEPKMQVFKQWAGINFNESPENWEPGQSWPDSHSAQTDLPMNVLAVQNNVVTTELNGLQTRNHSIKIADAPYGRTFNGTVCLRDDVLYAAMTDGTIWRKRLSSIESEWMCVAIHNSTGAPIDDVSDIVWTQIGFFQNTMICLREKRSKGDDSDGRIYISEKFDSDRDSNIEVQNIRCYSKIKDPVNPPRLSTAGTLLESTESRGVRLNVSYTYSNKMGSTLASDDAVIWVDSATDTFSGKKYLVVKGDLPANFKQLEVTGVDIYYSSGDYMTKAFMGHVDIDPKSRDTFDTAWTYNWYGGLADTSIWTNVPLSVPVENTTRGVDATRFTAIDSRLYFWGGSVDYRLYIGGNAGNELSVAIGTGGAYIDIEPGSGVEVRNVHKFKTQSGSNIVTILTGSHNTSKVKRYNLIETTIAYTSDSSTKTYQYEEVSNVVGCNSYWGSGVWGDGLYTISRYGLCITTQQMEYSSNLRANIVSKQIEPIFTDQLASMLDNARMIEVNEKIYIALGTDDDKLDDIIFCYDAGKKIWYTLTNDTGNQIVHIFNIDSDTYHEGIGIVEEKAIRLIPETGYSYKTEHADDSVSTIIQTADLSTKIPIQQTANLFQMEFRFDWLIGDVTVCIDGIDHYGRPFNVVKMFSSENVSDSYTGYIRVEKIVEHYRVTIKSDNADYRLTHMISKLFTTSNKIGTPYGFDSHNRYMSHHHGVQDRFHTVRTYNNLKDAIIA